MTEIKFLVLILGAFTPPPTMLKSFMRPAQFQRCVFIFHKRNIHPWHNFDCRGVNFSQNWWNIHPWHNYRGVYFSLTGEIYTPGTNTGIYISLSQWNIHSCWHNCSPCTGCVYAKCRSYDRQGDRKANLLVVDHGSFIIRCKSFHHRSMILLTPMLAHM